MRCKIGDMVMIVNDKDNSGRFGTIITKEQPYGLLVWGVQPQHTFFTCSGPGSNDYKESAKYAYFLDKNLIPIPPDGLEDEEDLYSTKPLSFDKKTPQDTRELTKV